MQQHLKTLMKIFDIHFIDAKTTIAIPLSILFSIKHKLLFNKQLNWHQLNGLKS